MNSKPRNLTAASFLACLAPTTSRQSNRFETSDLTKLGYLRFLTAGKSSFGIGARISRCRSLCEFISTIGCDRCPNAGCFSAFRRLRAKYLAIQILAVTRLQWLGLDQLEGSASVGLPLGPQENRCRPAFFVNTVREIIEM